MLWVALFFSALLGIKQEQLYSQYGKHNTEALFYVVRNNAEFVLPMTKLIMRNFQHALSLPAFVFMAGDIYKHVLIFNESGIIFV